MIIKGATDPEQLLVTFHLCDVNNPIAPIDNHVFTLGEVTVAGPGFAETPVALANIAFVAHGDYTAQLTTAQAAAAGKVFVFCNAAVSQPASAEETIVDPALFANGGAGGGNGGPLAASGFRTWTLAQLQSAVQHRGQYENSIDITPTLITEFLNEAIAELWDLIVEKWADYYTISATFAVVAGTDSYQLPGGFYKLRKVELQWTSTTWHRLEPHDLAISHEFRIGSGRHYRYRLQAGSLVFVPVPQQAEAIRLYYVPCAPLLAGPTDAIDGINGYEELVIQLALLRCKRREDLDTSDIEREVARLGARVRTAADGRDATEPFYLNARRGGRRRRRGGGCEDWD